MIVGGGPVGIVGVEAMAGIVVGIVGSWAAGHSTAVEDPGEGRSHCYAYSNVLWGLAVGF